MRPLKVFSIRLPVKAVKELKELAHAQYIPTRTMIRAWIMQRLEAEQMNGTLTSGGDLVGITPDRGEHRTHGVDEDD